jgi:hypothetical protein
MEQKEILELQQISQTVKEYVKDYQFFEQVYKNSPSQAERKVVHGLICDRIRILEQMKQRLVVLIQKHESMQKRDQ